MFAGAKRLADRNPVAMASWVSPELFFLSDLSILTAPIMSLSALFNSH